jgi:hypothetical protein
MTDNIATGDRSITLNLSALESSSKPAPLYDEDSQGTVVEAYLTLDEDGEVGLTTLWPHGGTPAHIWHGRTRTWKMDAAVHGGHLRAFLESDSTLDLLEAVHQSHTVEWDGHNEAGRLDECGWQASEALQTGLDALSESESVQVWHVADWLQRTRVDDWWAVGQSFEDVVAELANEAEAHDVQLEGDLADYVRERLLDEYEDDERVLLRNEQRAALQEHKYADRLARIDAKHAD